MNKNTLVTVQSRFLDDVIDGLSGRTKTLPSKYFYDKRGSVLFEQICQTDEYYLTKAELKILRSRISDIVRTVGSHALLIELGSGSSTKTKLLLNELENLSAYIPVDIAREFLNDITMSLRKEFPDLRIIPIAADYTLPFTIPNVSGTKKSVFFYPGSTIGNFTPSNAAAFLSTIAGMMKAEDGLLIGVDQKKDPSILKRAYNDQKGVTAAFNKNLLVRINRELDGDFHLDQFQHKAVYNPDEDRVEMHLVSLADQTVQVAGSEFYFKKGESIHTENSSKYHPEEFSELASKHFTAEKIWTDPDQYFSIFYMTKRS